MANPLNSSGSSSDPRTITNQISSLLSSSKTFGSKATPILQAYQEEKNASWLGRVFYILLDFLASFSVFIEPSPKVRLIRLVQECSKDLNEKSINEVASAILGSSEIVLTTIKMQQEEPINDTERQSIEERIDASTPLLGRKKKVDGTTSVLAKTIKKKPEAAVKRNLKEEITPHSTKVTKGPIRVPSSKPGTGFFSRVYPTSKLDEKGFKNLGSTCFLNSGIRLFLSKNNIEDLLFDIHDKELSSKSLNRKAGESDETFGARQKLLGDIISLFKEVKKETSDRKEIEKWLRNIGSNPIFIGKLAFFRREEDAHEFLSIVMDALELDNDSRMTLKSHRDVNNGGIMRPFGIDQALPIVELYATDQLEADPSQLIRENLAEEEINGKHYTLSLRHPNIEDLKSLMIRMPRFDAAMNRTSKPINPIFEPFEIKVFDEAKNKEVTVRLNPKSAVCHIGSSIKSGHYVVIIREGDKFFEKSDSFYRELTKEMAERAAKKNVYLVDYDVEVLNDEAIGPIPPLDEASHPVNLDGLNERGE